MKYINVNRFFPLLSAASLAAFLAVSCSDDPQSPDSGQDVPEEIYARFLIPEHESSLGALAFPGAEGGGMYTTGGRGGKVIHVTNLNDSGTGSLRDAINQSGARTIVFDVAGIISLKSELRVRNGDVTIAGQTAPGDGICLKDNTVRIDADNVIIRFMRFRLGDEGSGLSDGSDTIWGRYHENIILDHCSMSWSIDECASFYGNSNFTMQWCILTESLKNSVHGKGSHGYGGIWGGEDASFHHNMLSCHDSRNPRFDHPELYGTPSDPDRRGNVDFRNNVIYNWGNNSTYGGEGGHFNMVANYYRQGPASRDREYFIDANGIYTSNGTDYGYPYLYMDGNFYYDYPSMTAQDGVYWHDDKTNTPPDPSRLLSSVLPVSGAGGKPAYTTTHSPSGAFDAVCSYGGASLRRDAVDERACSDAASGGATFSDGGNGSTGASSTPRMQSAGGRPTQPLRKNSRMPWIRTVTVCPTGSRLSSGLILRTALTVRRSVWTETAGTATWKCTSTTLSGISSQGSLKTGNISLSADRSMPGPLFRAVRHIFPLPCTEFLAHVKNYMFCDDFSYILCV